MGWLRQTVTCSPYSQRTHGRQNYPGCCTASPCSTPKPGSACYQHDTQNLGVHILRRKNRNGKSSEILLDIDSDTEIELIDETKIGSDNNGLLKPGNRGSKCFLGEELSGNNGQVVCNGNGNGVTNGGQTVRQEFKNGGTPKVTSL